MSGLVFRQYRLNRRVVDAGVEGDGLRGGSARSAARCQQPDLEQGREPYGSTSAPRHIVTVIPLPLAVSASRGCGSSLRVSARLTAFRRNVSGRAARTAAERWP